MYFFAIDQLASAQAAFDAGRFTQARVLAESGPATAPAAALLARIYEQLKFAQRAESDARQGNPSVQHNPALYLAAVGQRKLAAQWEGRFAKALEADTAASLQEALLYGEIADHAQAISFGLVGVEKQDRLELRLLLARAYEATGKGGIQ